MLEIKIVNVFIRKNRRCSHNHVISLNRNRTKTWHFHITVFQCLSIQNFLCKINRNIAKSCRIPEKNRIDRAIVQVSPRIIRHR